MFDKVEVYRSGPVNPYIWTKVLTIPSAAIIDNGGGSYSFTGTLPLGFGTWNYKCVPHFSTGGSSASSPTIAITSTYSGGGGGGAG
tara:strand:+ start:2993 stop:3250 length:258 start_codon:yes stop_codon:yes gene_type:complete